MKQAIGHESIRAFAGSGKTHALVNRYILLLALGVRPGRINALTFTRKAAGEFLQKILLRLMDASGNASDAKQLAQEIGLPEMDRADFGNLLSVLVTEMGDLQLGTIDSFFARILTAFPYELGLTRPHRIMDEFEYGIARRLAMQALLGSGDEDRETMILQLYKSLTWGVEEKNVYSLFDDRLKAHQSLFIESEDASLWGAGRLIFRSSPWWLTEEKDISVPLAAARKALSACGLDNRPATAFGNLLNAFENWQPGQELKGGTILEQLLAQHDNLDNGTANILYYRKEVPVSVDLGQSLLALIRIFMSQEIARRLVMTSSLGKILQEFDRLYDQFIREAGSLVFSDLPVLLIKGLTSGDPAFSTSEMIYRLDGRADHWLIDEFQDTSRIQWKVLSHFIDEILQDTEGRRSFFYVGDVKQSIYSWRGGDPRLFDEILNQYNTTGEVIQSIPLRYSWRSAPPVLDCVNALFGEGIEQSGLTQAVRTRWKQSWLIHEPSDLTREFDGHACWGLVDHKNAVPDACIEIIRSIDPLEKGLSCAVLVRKNSEVSTITQALREEGIPASMEGIVHLSRDNFLGRWILAFLYSLARAGDSFPLAYLECAGMPVDGPSIKRLQGLIRSVLTNDGYAEAVRRLIAFVEQYVEFDDFLHRRGEQLLEAATRFEATQMRTLEQFIAYFDEATVAESSLQTQVQVMTVHKSKGLDFDIVLVAGFGASPIVRSNHQDLHVERDAAGDIAWILDLPPKSVYENDETLLAAHLSHEEELEFEALCLLYVAMTRAKQGLYVVSEKPVSNSSRVTWHALFKSAFSPATEELPSDGSVEWQMQRGNAIWHEQVRKSSTTNPEPWRLHPLKDILPDHRPMLARAPSPSTEAHAELNLPTVLRSTAGREFGSRMHDFLAEVEWLDGHSMADYLQRAGPELMQRLEALFASELGQAVFTQPDSNHVLWREKPYVLRDGEKVSHGIIDRAIVMLDENGNPADMTIYDFKTDRLDPDRPAGDQLLERYAPQLERYREAAMALTGLGSEDIRTVLIPV